ncbi:MAG: hypothetical protein ABSE68_02205 [Minisyncoccia bacterium]
MDEKNLPLKIFAEFLATTTAKALSIPGTEGELTAKDIEVEVREFGKYDINQADVEIIVFANEYPERLENLEERRKQMGKDIYSWLGEPSFESPMWLAIKKVSIWIPLVRGGAYGEFTL